MAAFPQLRDLGLRWCNMSPQVLQARRLPASIRDLTLTLCLSLTEFHAVAATAPPPVLDGCHRLHNLRQITFAGYYVWQLGFTDTERRHDPVRLPPSLEVRTGSLCDQGFSEALHECRSSEPLLLGMKLVH